MSEMYDEIKQRTVDALLDDLAGIAGHWRRNREEGRMPKAIRGALILLAKDIYVLTRAADEVSDD